MQFGLLELTKDALHRNPIRADPSIAQSRNAFKKWGRAIGQTMHVSPVENTAFSCEGNVLFFGGVECERNVQRSCFDFSMWPRTNI